jgi:hypothetical protein
MFADQSNLPGRLESRLSRGSSTREFLGANVQGRTLTDTVYVTANPQLYRHRDWLDVEFHAVHDVWMDDWDDDLETVRPETLTERAITYADAYPDKRLIVHYIQPHYPFIASDVQPFDHEQAFQRPDEAGSWHQVMTGDLDVSVEDVWAAYRANLDRALDSVSDLATDLRGKTVISADHGNMVGERARPFPIREWGHPRGIYTEELVKVPWLVIEGDRRKTIQDQPGGQGDRDIEEDVVADRLEQLGYTA